LVLVENAQIPAMKINQKEYETGFFELSSLKNKMLLESKSQAVNKDQRQLRLELYFPEFF